MREIINWWGWELEHAWKWGWHPRDEWYVIFKFETNGSLTHRNLWAKKRSRHCPQWGHTPFDIVSLGKNHWACNCENIMSHFYIPCFITFSASAIPTPFFKFSQHRFGCVGPVLKVAQSMKCPVYKIIFTRRCRALQKRLYLINCRCTFWAWSNWQHTSTGTSPWCSLWRLERIRRG